MNYPSDKWTVATTDSRAGPAPWFRWPVHIASAGCAKHEVRDMLLAAVAAHLRSWRAVGDGYGPIREAVILANAQVLDYDAEMSWESLTRSTMRIRMMRWEDTVE